MKSIQTPWSKTGVTTREVTAQVGGPSRLKGDLVVPVGTAVRFIGRWVVANLDWLAKLDGKRTFEFIYPDSPLQGSAREREIMSCGRNGITYHDADHYGIDIDAADVGGIKEVKMRVSR